MSKDKDKFELSEIPDLLTFLKDKEEEIDVRMTAADVIGTLEMLPVSGLPVIGSNRNISDEIIISFKKILEDKSEDYRLRLAVLNSLNQQKAIISILAPFLESKDIDIVSTLEQISLDEDDNNYVRKHAAEVLQSWYTYWQRGLEAAKRKTKLTKAEKKVRKEVERVIRNSREPVSPKVLFGMGIASNSDVLKALDALEEEGKMKRVQSGNYVWTGD